MKQVYARPKRMLYALKLCSLIRSLFFIAALAFSNSLFAQFTPDDCGNIQCTSKDVRIIRAYLSGPGGIAINCGDADPFNGAELHLVINTNTQRIGISISTILKADAQEFQLANCFSGETLNTGSDNDLAFNLGTLLSVANATCATEFKLADVFTSWGVGGVNAGDFCSGNIDPKCPATPAKCRFQPGDAFHVDVKLDVDFSWKVGECPNGNTVDFTSTVDLGADVDPGSITYAWDFDGDNTNDPEATTANPTKTFSGPGTYSVTLTVSGQTTGATPIAVGPKSVTKFVLIESCCDISTPTLSNASFCVPSGQSRTVADLIATFPALPSGQTYEVFEGSDPELYDTPLDGITVLTTNTSYYVAVRDELCVSGRDEVSVTLNQTPGAPTVTSPVYYCKNDVATALTATGSNLLWYTGPSGGTGSATAPTPSTATVGSVDYYVSQTENGCESARAKITVTVRDLPAVFTLTASPACAGSATGSIILSSSVTGVSYQLKQCAAPNDNVQGAKAGAGTLLTWTGLVAGCYYIVATNTTTQCSSNTAQATVISAICNSTLTQGFYGNVGGKDCNNKTAIQIITAALGGSNKTFGAGNRSFTLKTTDLAGSKPKIFIMLPGGSTPNVLGSTNISTPTGACIGFATTATYDCSTSWPNVPIQPSGSAKGSINNVLLAQTMSLFFNLQNSATLGGIVLTGNRLTFNNLACGSSTPGTFASTQTIPCSVYNYLSNTGNYSSATIANLYDLANKVLGGVVNTISASDMNAALNAINVGFDKGKALVSQANTCSAQARISQGSIVNEMRTITELAVTTYPNPYSNKVRFTIANPTAGQGSLEVFNMLGQKVKTVYRGHMPAGNQTYDLSVPGAQHSSLIYILRVGDKRITGKLMQLKQ